MLQVHVMLDTASITLQRQATACEASILDVIRETAVDLTALLVELIAG